MRIRCWKYVVYKTLYTGQICYKVRKETEIFDYKVDICDNDYADSKNRIGEQDIDFVIAELFPNSGIKRETLFNNKKKMFTFLKCSLMLQFDD